ncbi:MAG: hypothetical protein PHO63_06075 [Bacilli bacterium]|nr:hypothetical protein [Bacilli bacterium]MDD4809167.1 hypothetical protein [Bacilli bacterium]
MKERHTETYIFRSDDTAKRKIGNALSNESYYKQDVIGAVEQAIIDGRLKKAVKIDNPKRSKSNIYYVFKMVDEQNRDTFKVGIPRKLYNEEDAYIRSLNSLKEAGVNIKVANRTRLALAAGVLILSTAIMAGGFVKGLEKEWEYQDKQMESYFQEINESRREQGIPPINLVNEEGIPYDSWEQYFRDHPDNQEPVQEETPKTR